MEESRRFKVLQILEATTGGTRKHLYYLLKHLDKERFELSLICSSLRDPHFQEDLKAYRKMGVKLYDVPMRREIHLLSDLVAFVRILRILARERFDLVHAHSSKAGFIGRMTARCCGIPVVVYSPHSFAFQYCPNSLQSTFYRQLERIAALFQHRMLCVSEGERRVALRYGICPARKAHVIANAIETPSCSRCSSLATLRAELGIDPRDKVVGMVAHFRPQKGFPCFIRAIPSILRKEPHTRFLIVGEGPLLDAVQHHVRSLGVAENVIFTGYRPDVLPYYRIMDLFVLSSLWEGMPYVILEAMAAGLPIVATATVGNDELVVDGENGFLVQSGDSDEISRRILQLLQDDVLRKSFASRSLQLSRQRPTIEKWIHAYEQFYTDALLAASSSRFRFSRQTDR